MLGAAFNPPHLGHLLLAQEAAWQLELDEVVLVPTGEAPHKQIEQDPGAELRLEMAELAAADEPELSVSALEVERPGPSYSYATLEQLAAEHPNTELCLLMGADAAVGFGGWERPERVLELAALGVTGRPGVDEGELRAALDRAGAAERARLFTMPAVEVSSSAVRARVAAGRPIRHLVPEAVAATIESRGLYR
ncbi:MAG: nicotinate-nucleotide adenylyltransferase [Solirubrobacterales bacterium]|nr:nicotinate-nucleotide adenylyltransferase [Solirubrobacterales bacterium]